MLKGGPSGLTAETKSKPTTQALASYLAPESQDKVPMRIPAKEPNTYSFLCVLSSQWSTNVNSLSFDFDFYRLKKLLKRSRRNFKIVGRLSLFSWCL